MKPEDLKKLDSEELQSRYKTTRLGFGLIVGVTIVMVVVAFYDLAQGIQFYPSQLLVLANLLLSYSVFRNFKMISDEINLRDGA